MANLVDTITVDRDHVFKGAAYLVYGNLASFPGELESVINPTSYALAAGLTALCPTNEDGVSLTRSSEVSDGIAIDQKNYNLDEGEPDSWTMEMACTLLNTTIDAIKIAWQTVEPDDVVGSLVTQKRLSLGAPATFTERQLYVIQEDAKTTRLRVFAFRKVVPQVDSELNIQSSDATGMPANWKIRPDSAIAEHHGPFGFIFEEAAS